MAIAEEGLGNCFSLNWRVTADAEVSVIQVTPIAALAKIATELMRTVCDC